MRQIKTRHIKERVGLETYYRLIAMPFDSNVSSPSQVTTDVDYGRLSKEVQEVIMSLPLVKFTGRFDSGGLDKRQQFYIMTTLKENFIVDTQGSNYARYVSKIKNLPDISHKNIERVFESNEDIAMLKRIEVFEVNYDGVLYKIEIVEEDGGTFASIEYDGNYVMDVKLEEEIMEYFNKHR